MIATKAIPGQRRIHGLGGLKSSPGSARGGQPPESAEPEEVVPGRASRRRRFVEEFSPKRSEAPGAARTAARLEPRGEKRMQPPFRTVPPPSVPPGFPPRSRSKPGPGEVRGWQNDPRPPLEFRSRARAPPDPILQPAPDPAAGRMRPDRAWHKRG